MTYKRKGRQPKFKKANKGKVQICYRPTVEVYNALVGICLHNEISLNVVIDCIVRDKLQVGLTTSEILHMKELADYEQNYQNSNNHRPNSTKE